MGLEEPRGKERIKRGNKCNKKFKRKAQEEAKHKYREPRGRGAHIEEGSLIGFHGLFSAPWWPSGILHQAKNLAIPR